ncbi:MAG: glycosyl transferase family 2 [Stygiobacter sp.]|nr:MAG: glycosyl transferase family 2 [Stygiobacter sp.]KAF0216518.1 MAG: glycosyl transferase family [Ignavibacteria bacterium]
MPRLTLSMIVKNEEKYIKDCLESVKDIADEIIIIDTGSTDDTIRIAESYGAKVYNFEWVNDFSAARNFALGKSTGEWILYLDADERMDANSIHELKRIIGTSQRVGYYCTVKSIDREESRDNSMSYVRLFANSPEIKFVGKVHEQIVPSLTYCDYTLSRSSILIHHIGYNVSVEDKQKKAARNLPLLLEEYSANKDAYYAFQLAQTYNVLGDDENASVYFKIASESAKLDRQYRAQCYASLALIAHKNFKALDAEKYIAYSLKVDDKQPFSFLLASKISHRKGELNLAEDKCKRAYVLNQALLVKGLDVVLCVLLDPEEVIYYGLILALQTKNNANYHFYQKELFALYQSRDETNGTNNYEPVQKIFSNSAFSKQEVDAITGLINKNNLNFFLFMLGNNPYKQQVILIVDKLRVNFPDSLEVRKLDARLLEEFGRIDEAIEILESVVKENQTDPAVFFYLISYYLKLGKEDKIKPMVLLLEKYFSHIPDVMTRVRMLKRKLLMLTTVPL